MLETNLAKPFLVVYIIWHPDFAGGAGLAEILRGHFRRELYQNVAGGTGLSVIFRSEPLPETGSRCRSIFQNQRPPQSLYLQNHVCQMILNGGLTFGSYPRSRK